MDFDFTEEQLMVRNTAREFAVRELAPIAVALDREGRYPAEQVKTLGELGLLGVAIPEEHGGAGFDYVAYVMAIEELSKVCAGTGVIASVNNSLVCDPLSKYCTPEQKKRFLQPLASGRQLGCFALTEPSGGSDVAALKAVAEKKGDGYVLRGEKNFITNGPNADVAIVFAYTDRTQKHKGMSAFIVPLDMAGVTRGPVEHKLGIRASHSCSLIFDDVALPTDLLLGNPGDGFKIAMTTLDAGRIGIAAQALGIAQAALDEAVAYAKERQAFGGPIANLQAIQFKLADMATRLAAARLLTFHAARLKDQHQKHSKESAMAKVYASETASFVANHALQIHGGYGYVTDFNAERHFRDARITEIYEGTSEIQRLVVAGAVIKDA